MIAWDGRKGTEYRYIYGCLALIMPTLSKARETYVKLLPYLSHTKKVSIDANMHRVEIEVTDKLNHSKSAIVRVTDSGHILATKEFLMNRHLFRKEDVIV